MKIDLISWDIDRFKKGQTLDMIPMSVGEKKF
jgi:hypothetical protein